LSGGLFDFVQEVGHGIGVVGDGLFGLGGRVLESFFATPDLLGERVLELSQQRVDLLSTLGGHVLLLVVDGVLEAFDFGGSLPTSG
jgi:hypothetical protein